MSGFVYKTEAFGSEPTVEFVSTGIKGGDAGHGGYATLKITLSSSDSDLRVHNKDTGLDETSHLGSGDTISLTVYGDWELGGLEDAIIAIGEALKASPHRKDED